jgi:ribose transport system ATP-binding protein
MPEAGQHPGPGSDGTEALELRHVSKKFGGVTVLSDATLCVRSGEVHALLGQNGAGKSTLVRILSGFYLPEPGAEVRVWGVTARLPIAEPVKLGLGLVHQDLPFVDGLSIIDNLGAGTHYNRQRSRPLRPGREAAKAAALLSEFNIRLDPRDPITTATQAERSLLNIARTIRGLREYGHSRFILLLDEPTSYLPQTEATQLLERVRSLTAEGSAVLFITHRLKEALTWCDTISVLRNGVLVQTSPAREIDEHRLEYLMFGTSPEAMPHAEEAAAAAAARPAAALQASNIAGRALRRVSLELRAGEITGVTGLTGMGQDELPYLLSGAMTPTGGSLAVAGKPVRLTPKTAPEHGIILVPGNRQRDGLWMDGTVLENITITQLLAVSRHGLLARRRERVAAMSLIDRYGVVPPSPVRQCRTLSGGNQQKVLLARALSGDTRVLLLHEPTQGVDVGSARDIMRIVVKMAQQGAAVCVCSSDFALIAALSHRVLILTHGQISAELGTGAIDEETIAACAQGLRGGQGDPPPGSPSEPGAARPTAGRRHADADEL